MTLHVKPGLEPAPPVEIVGRFRSQTRLGRMLIAYYNEPLQDREFANEIPHTPERRDQLYALDNALMAFGKDVGVDLSERLPRAEYHHFFRSKEDLIEAIGTLEDTSTSPDQEAQVNQYGIFCVESDDLFATLDTLCHERFHFADGTRIRLAQEANNDYTILNPRTAYTILNSRTDLALGPQSSGLTEMFTDLRKLHLMKGGYWDKQSGLPERHDIYGYTNLDILGDALLQDSAKRQGIGPIELLRAVEKDMFMSRSNGLRQLLVPYGTHARKILVGLPHTEPELAREAAFDLGLPEAAAKIDALRAGKQVEPVLDWVDASH